MKSYNKIYVSVEDFLKPFVEANLLGSDKATKIDWVFNSSSSFHCSNLCSLGFLGAFECGAW